MDYLRTPDTCFENLPGYPWAPHYAQVDDGEGHEALGEARRLRVREAVLVRHR